MFQVIYLKMKLQRVHQFLHQCPLAVPMSRSVVMSLQPPQSATVPQALCVSLDLESLEKSRMALDLAFSFVSFMVRLG